MVQVVKILVLGVSSAAVIVVDPLIIYKVKSMQTSWYGDKALPYGKSENSRSI